MRGTIYKQLLTGLLCASLLLADLMCTGATVFAAETETKPITETELPQEETHIEAEEYCTNIVENEAQDVSEVVSVVEGETQKSEFAEDKLETEEIKLPEEDKSEEHTTEVVVTEEAAEEETVTKETENIGENSTETEAETEESKNCELSDSDDNIASGTINETYGHITWVIDKNGKLTVEGTGDFAPSVSGIASASRIPWYNYRTSIKSAKINMTGMTDATYLFYRCSNLTSIDLSSFDTSKITRMYGMFRECNSLTSLDLSNFDTPREKQCCVTVTIPLRAIFSNTLR